MDDLLDLFDRDSRRQHGSGRKQGGLRNLLGRLTGDEHDDERDRRTRYPDDDDDGPRAGNRSRRRRDDADLFDL